MKRALISVLVLLCAISCIPQDDDILARVGSHILYKNEVAKLLPKDISPEDSTMIVSRYIDSWALGHLLLMKAEEQLSKADKDISAEIEEYRKNILCFRYEKLYVENRMDTVVSENELQTYFSENGEKFTYNYSLLKGRVIEINKKSPFYKTVLDLYKVTDTEDIENLKAACRSYAEKYEDFKGDWVPISSFAALSGSDASSLESQFATKNSCIIEKETTNVLIFIEERIAPGILSPMEFNEKKIKDAILSRRKQEILSSLERDLLEEAVENDKLIIYQ